jgi:hypothetical protein
MRANDRVKLTPQQEASNCADWEAFHSSGVLIARAAIEIVDVE